MPEFSELRQQAQVAHVKNNANPSPQPSPLRGARETEPSAQDSLLASLMKDSYGRWGKAAEGCRSPKREAFTNRSDRRQLLDCGSPLPLSFCPRSRFIRTLFILLPLLLVIGCASAPHGKTKAASITPAPIAPYVRIAYPSADVIELQIAVRKFVPERGAGTAIWLVGASHVGESNYYAALQQRLDIQPLVLYEGVSAQAREVQKRPKAPKVKKETEEGESLQDVMAQSLGLAFQLNAIDYYQPNFRNSDMTIAQLQDYFQKKSPKHPDEAGGNAEFQHLMEMMQGKSIWSTVVQAGLRMIGSSPKLQSLSRLVMIETLGQMRGNMAQFQGLGPEMRDLLTGLIQERNKVVLRDLKDALHLPKPPASVGIFYGAAHMEDMQKRICADFHYRPAEETWLAAFSVNTADAGISDAEASLIHSWVKWELEQLQRRPE